jgi:prevent-host-death family protein
MKFSAQIKPISYLKNHTAEIVKNISESRRPLLITQNGEAKLVVMDIKSYEEQEETLALLKILALGNSEIEQGMCQDMEAVFTELDKVDHE